MVILLKMKILILVLAYFSTAVSANENGVISDDNSARNLLGSIGTEFFREIASFEPSNEYDVNYGNRVSMSMNSKMIAITGSEQELDDGSANGNGGSTAVWGDWRGYVEVHNLQTGQREAIIHSDAGKYDPPAMDAVVSGDGTKIAVAAVHVLSGTDSDVVVPFSGVKVYQRSADGSWSLLGTPINAGVAGARPGLRVSLSETGDYMVIGSRNFNGGNGRTMVYKLDPDTGNYTMSHAAVNGVSANDHEGSSVSVTRDGGYFATGSTGFEASGDDGKANQGRVRIYDLAKNQQVGSDILGEGQNDASGFSTSLMKIDSTLVVAIGAIYNDPSPDKVNAGHVRVYTFTVGIQDMTWQQLGADLDGDNGIFLDFDNDKFHIGDYLGMALQLSDDGKRIAIGAPYYFGPGGNRDSDYYYGKVKLFKFQPSDESTATNGDWLQIAEDMVGSSKSSQSGYSLALDANGKTIIIGGPSETGGGVIVYYQDEISGQPSVAPSLVPSVSFEPSVSLLPSTIPTGVKKSVGVNLIVEILGVCECSDEATAVVANAVSSSYELTSDGVELKVDTIECTSNCDETRLLLDLAAASSQQSIEFFVQARQVVPIIEEHKLLEPIPSFDQIAESVEEIQPDVQNVLDAPIAVEDIIFTYVAYPSAAPSTTTMPTLEPSLEPSLSPSSYSKRTFTIISTSPAYSELQGNDNRNWCLQTKSKTNGAVLFVRPCSTGFADKQRWYLEENKLKLRMTDNVGTFCVKDNGHKLMLQGCDTVTSTISLKDMNSNFAGPIVLTRNGREFYFGISTSKIFTRVRLLTKTTFNPSKLAWKLEFVEEGSASP